MSAINREADASVSNRLRSYGGGGVSGKMVDKAMQVFSNLYSAENPDGFIDIGVAHNALMDEEMIKKVREVSVEALSESYPYQSSAGIMALRRELRSVLMRNIKGDEIHEDDLTICGGAASGIEFLAFSICDPGNGVMIPAPYYSSFDGLTAMRPAAVVLRCYLKDLEKFTITRADLDKCYAEAQKNEINVRMFILTNPNNPLGRLLSHEEIITVAKFCNEHRMHLIVDELYSNTVHLDSPEQFESAVSVCRGHLDPLYLHVIYGVSKDFGLSGWRLGCIYTKNRKIHSAIRQIPLMLASSQTQYTIYHLLKDHAWLDSYLATNRIRIRENKKIVMEELTKAGISFLETNATFAMCINLSQICYALAPSLFPGQVLNTAAFKVEEMLFEKFLKEKVYLTTGGSFYYPQAGYFRLCYGTETPKLLLGLQRLRSAITSFLEKHPLPAAQSDGRAPPSPRDLHAPLPQISVNYMTSNPAHNPQDDDDAHTTGAPQSPMPHKE